MLKIRPHHILCMRAYSGNGYSEEFKIKIEGIIKEIQAYNEFLQVDNLKEEIKEVELVFYTDSICEKCPNKLGENLCSSQEKVNLLDFKVINHFNLKEGIYNYKDLEDLVYGSINECIFDDICKECEWYGIANCKDYIKL
ncbi:MULTISPECIES: DUF1284 domain-containing protein [Terrisporobacter]|mgnify:CR=1 FL=1|uniref:DUF1284 domain-containing protein n=1 Tax=Terrisporobacter muris TaxID=2963284 RepID=A0A9X2S5A8_9FIRM|nr:MULTISPECIES: DUF1284 domain-containing protein [Terrisporobacter]MCR1824416.1 DUF1284 domain-containing protein [Terrisporobacter muris]MDY3371744.1 DUF1284 domain-containing protein [Terrisporobacter othiniensis]